MTTISKAERIRKMTLQILKDKNSRPAKQGWLEPCPSFMELDGFAAERDSKNLHFFSFEASNDPKVMRGQLLTTAKDPLWANVGSLKHGLIYNAYRQLVFAWLQMVRGERNKNLQDHNAGKERFAVFKKALDKRGLPILQFHGNSHRIFTFQTREDAEATALYINIENDEQKEYYQHIKECLTKPVRWY